MILQAKNITLPDVGHLITALISAIGNFDQEEVPQSNDIHAVVEMVTKICIEKPLKQSEQQENFLT